MWNLIYVVSSVCSKILPPSGPSAAGQLVSVLSSLSHAHTVVQRFVWLPDRVMLKLEESLSNVTSDFWVMVTKKTGGGKIPVKMLKNKLEKCSVDCFGQCLYTLKQSLWLVVLVFPPVLDVVTEPVATAGKGAK